MPRKLSTQTTKTPVAVVAGGAGFLGSHVCESLLKSGIKVLALDNLITGSLTNLEAIKKHPNFEFVECNVNQGIPSAVGDQKIDYIVHAAGIETHGESKQATLAMALTGAFGTKNLLDLAVSAGARFLLVSTINVYEGLASSTNLSYYFGSSPAQEARFSQQEAKRYAEGLCELYAQEYNLDVRVARISQLYGPRMDVRTPELISRLIGSTLAGADLEIDTDSSQTLLLTYVADAVYGISRLLFAEGKSFKGSIYSFANPEKVSVISIAYTLREFLPAGKDVKFLPVDTQPEFTLPKLSLDAAKRDLGWEPMTSVTDGLKLTIQSFQQVAPPAEGHRVTQDHLQTSPQSRVEDELPQLRASEEPVVPDGPATPKLRFRGGEGAVTSADMVVRDASPAERKVSNKPQEDSSRTAQAPSAKRRPTHWWRRWFLAGMAILLYTAIGRPVIHTAVYTGVGALHARMAADHVKHLQFSAAKQSLAAAEQDFQSGSDMIARTQRLAGLFGQSRAVAQVKQGLRGAADTAGGLEILMSSAQPMYEQVQHLVHFDGPSTDGPTFASVVADSRTTIGQARERLERAKLAFEPTNSKVAGVSTSGGTDVVPGSWIGSLLNQGDQMIGQLLHGLKDLDAALAVLPTAFGDKEEKEYLILLQNSNELRPTGGFLGSFAALSLKGGRVSNFKIDDIYNPAGQVKSTTPAPEAIVTAFGGKMLSIQDANWSPDVAVSAEQVADLYEKATGESVDGVVFVTTQAIKEIMAAVGPLKIDGYKETVTADNFTQLAQVYADVGFEPGSTGKTDFLGAMANQLLNRLQHGGDALLLPVAKAGYAGLLTKEVTLWARDDQVQKVLARQQWVGGMTATKGDYLRVVDANLGANKANYYVTRRTEYAINVDRDSALHGVVKVTWKHTGTSATWPGGDYLNYVRIYVPDESVLSATSGFRDDEVTVSKESGKTVFGGFVKVPYASEKTVEIRYSLPLSLSLPEQDDGYHLTWQKQSGIVEEPLRVIFNAPLFLEAASTGGGQTQPNGSIEWSGHQLTDTSLQLKLERKHAI